MSRPLVLLTSCFSLVLGAAGCRSSSAPEDSPRAQASPRDEAAPVGGEDELEDELVFSIDGMRKINGAL